MVRKGKELNFDDTIQCRFYSRNKYCKQEWEYLCNDLNVTINKISNGYLWNRDEFKIDVPLQIEENKINIEYLISLTCFGDNIEDEWFIVYLVYELTKLYEDLIVHMEDGDGCFLLIEAANCLPCWLKPDNADNRVFLSQNCIHLINPHLISLEDDLDICSAVKILIDNCENTKASCEIQNAIQKRISGYPEKIQDTIHTAIVSLPKEIATVLKLKPSLISSIVNTYCNYDMFEAKICKEVNYTDCIDVSITFTKFLYAMLLHASLRKNVNKHYLTAQDEKKKVLGYKLTCGYELIMNQSTQDIFLSPEYKKFLNGLTNMGYFRNNIEGSQEYKELLEKAKTNFLTMECPMNKHIYNEICKIKTEDSFYNIKQQLSLGDFELTEDDDNWLNISPDQLDDVLTSRFGANTTDKDKTINSAQNITSALTDFLKKNSDFEGIEKSIEHSEDNKIEFDPDQFTKCLDKYLNIVTSNDTIELSDDSEYSDMDDEVSQQVDKELCSVLSYLPKSDHHTVKNNLIQSIKEEGLSGPSSNILKTIGINKTDLLDSDDDE
ncbi:protein ecdysoneless homolog isoform X1 [Pieris napi]|uniref:protein ecdysoneless homolog isoform X1 n=1 Tax=Pieris napi TaxID=78633 RepID=UPI001FBA5FE4|nr:protein ecdysoneless homolog isoform X1 [Pieris napi]